MDYSDDKDVLEVFECEQSLRNSRVCTGPGPATELILTLGFPAITGTSTRTSFLRDTLSTYP